MGDNLPEKSDLVDSWEKAQRRGEERCEEVLKLQERDVVNREASTEEQKRANAVHAQLFGESIAHQRRSVDHNIESTREEMALSRELSRDSNAIQERIAAALEKIAEKIG